jgi:hypothetical protein
MAALPLTACSSASPTAAVSAGRGAPDAGVTAGPHREGDYVALGDSYTAGQNKEAPDGKRPRCWQARGPVIDRKSVVGRHRVELTSPDPAAVLTVGNGDFAHQWLARGGHHHPFGMTLGRVVSSSRLRAGR